MKASFWLSSARKPGTSRPDWASWSERAELRATVSREMPAQLLTMALSRFTLRLSTARASMEMALSSSVPFTPLKASTEMGKAPWIKTITASETMRARRKDIFRFPFVAPASVRLRSLCTSCYSVPSAAA